MEIQRRAAFRVPAAGRVASSANRRGRCSHGHAVIIIIVIIGGEGGGTNGKRTPDTRETFFGARRTRSTSTKTRCGRGKIAGREIRRKGRRTVVE